MLAHDAATKLPAAESDMEAPSVQSAMLRKTAWIWLVGAIAWTFDALASLRIGATPRATLAGILAVLFLGAWLFFRNQTR